MKEIEEVFKKVVKEGRDFLLEPEGYFILNKLKIKTPKYIFFKDIKELKEEDLKKIPGQRIVLKIVSSKILHKSDVGGVKFIKKEFSEIIKAIEIWERKFEKLEGFLICEFIKYERGFGNEILIGTKYSKDFGNVLTIGFGGIETEFYAKNFKSLSIFSPLINEDKIIEKSLRETPFGIKIFGKFRNQKPLIEKEKIFYLLKKFRDLSNYFSPFGEGNFLIQEFEVNPFVIKNRKLIALDFLLKISKNEKLSYLKPIHKINNLLHPKSIGVVGVSEKFYNPGRIILNNILREGFPKEDIFCIKPNVMEIDGVKCYPSLRDLPKKLDLLVLSVDANQVPPIVEEVIEFKKTESIIIIPGGFGEKEGTKEKVENLKEKLRDLREKGEDTPILNGGNCLGIRSIKGKYDTFFIPEYKLPLSLSKPMGFALISQSGAFLVSKMNKLSYINPLYSISLGNQIDLTIADYLEFLKDIPELYLYALYVEGFMEMDGLRVAKISRELKEKGKKLLIYKAGKTAEGQKATSSHTASIAGDFLLSKEILEKNGAIITDSIGDFEDLIELFLFLRGKDIKGKRVALVSNAGFECVSMADNLKDLEVSKIEKTTEEKLTGIFKRIKIDAIVDIHNPLDLTPMANDLTYEEVIIALSNDPNVDSIILGAVPLTPALNTLQKGEKHREDFLREDSIANRIINLNKKIKKPLIVVVDAGKEYEPLIAHLKENQIPTFRSAEKAMSVYSQFLESFL